MLLQAYPKADFHKLLGQLAFTRCSASCSARPHYQESWRSRAARHDRISKKGRPACVHTLLGQLLGTTALPRKLAFTGCPTRPHFQERSASLRSHVARPVARHDHITKKAGVHGFLGTTALPRKVVFTSCSAGHSSQPQVWCSRVARPVEAHNPKAGVHKLLGQLVLALLHSIWSQRQGEWKQARGSS